MTIGIAVTGAAAGARALRGLQVVEAAGAGDIGGFAVFRALLPDGTLLSASTQRGGSAGLELSEDFLKAERVALISSGPDRPVPLEQFLPASAAGLVTGHRLPSSRMGNGAPVNAFVLKELEAGTLTPDRLRALLAAEPGLDAGLIVLSAGGGICAANAPRVAARRDGGFVERAGVAVMLNSIAGPGLWGQSLADLVADFVEARASSWQFGFLPAELRVTPAAFERIEIDAEGLVRQIYSANPVFQGSRPGITAVMSGCAVWRDGRACGHVCSEVWTDLADGLLRARPGRGHFLWQAEEAGGDAL